MVRGRKRKGVRYFGPYGHAGAIRSTLDLLVRSFPGPHVLGHQVRPPRAAGPALPALRHRALLGPVRRRRRSRGLRRLRRRTSWASSPATPSPCWTGSRPRCGTPPTPSQFERAARLRDRIAAAHKAAEAQQMVSERPEDFDVIGIAEDPLEASVQIFHVRRGRVVGHRGFVAEKVEDLIAPRVHGPVLAQVYGADGTEVPRRVLVPEPPADLDLLASWLRTMREGPVDIAVPQRGAKRALQETVTRSAGEDLARHRLRRASDHNARSKALTELQAALGLREAPLRIECFDMSHLQGTDYVGSMVVLEDGLVKRSDYRRFKVKTVAGNDDYAAMEEVLTRRLTALKDAPTRQPTAGAAAQALRLPAQPARWSTAARGSSRWPNGWSTSSGWTTRSSWPPWPSSSRRSTAPARPNPSACGAGPMPSTSSSGCGTRPTASPSPSTGSGGRKRMTKSVLDGIPGLGPGPQGPPGQGVRRGQRRAGGLPGGAAGPVVAARRGRARRLRGRAQGWTVTMSEFLVVTGMSGAGRSTAAAALEDLGWFVIDNLPAALIMKMAEMVDRPGSEIERVALVIGAGWAATPGPSTSTTCPTCSTRCGPRATGCACSSSTRPTTC